LGLRLLLVVGRLAFSRPQSKPAIIVCHPSTNSMFQRVAFLEKKRAQAPSSRQHDNFYVMLARRATVVVVGLGRCVFVICWRNTSQQSNRLTCSQTHQSVLGLLGLPLAVL